MAEPKYRTVKIPKPRSRGVRGRMALQKWQRSGGRQKQILNPETGKYVPALFGEAGQRQVQKLYPTDEGAAAEKKRDKLKKEQADRNIAGAAEAKKKAEALLAETKKKRKEKEAKAKAEKEAKAKADAEAKAAAESKIDIGRGPGSEAPVPPKPIRITEDAPKIALPDKEKIQEILKDLEKRVLLPDFKTPTRDEIAEAVTKATGGRYTPPATKVAEPGPPKAEPVVAATPPAAIITPTELAAKAQELREAAADPKTSSSKLLALAKEVQDATRVVQEQTAEKQAKAKTADEIRADAAAIVAGQAISAPTVVDIPGAGQVELPKFKYKAAMPDEGPKEIPQEVIDAAKDIFSKSTTPTATPAPSAPPPPQFVSMDPLQGVRETYVPTNILGQSFDPGVRENYTQRMMEAGSNIQQGGYPGFQMPTSAVPQVQFGGYGAPVPMAPLAPFAGLGGPPPPPQIASGAIVNPGTGKPMPVGIAPPMPRNPIK